MRYIPSNHTWPIPHYKAIPLSFFVDASFDASRRKWFWNNGKEIAADKWTYDCSAQPHQPATQLVMTLTDRGIFLLRICCMLKAMFTHDM